jgi:hypothetical protein
MKKCVVYKLNPPTPIKRFSIHSGMPSEVQIMFVVFDFPDGDYIVRAGGEVVAEGWVTSDGMRWEIYGVDRNTPTDSVVRDQ